MMGLDCGLVYRFGSWIMDLEDEVGLWNWTMELVYRFEW